MFAQDEGGEGLVGYSDVQVNLKGINTNVSLISYKNKPTFLGKRGMSVRIV